MAAAEAGQMKNTFSMEAGLIKNHSASRSGIDLNNVCQPNRSWIGLSYNGHSYHTRNNWGRYTTHLPAFHTIQVNRSNMFFSN